jgi:hypothetical protein
MSTNEEYETEIVEYEWKVGNLEGFTKLLDEWLKDPNGPWDIYQQTGLTTLTFRRRKPGAGA